MTLLFSTLTLPIWGSEEISNIKFDLSSIRSFLSTLIFTDSSGDTLLEFKKLSQTEVSVDELVDNINESLSWSKKKNYYQKEKPNPFTAPAIMVSS